MWQGINQLPENVDWQRLESRRNQFPHGLLQRLKVELDDIRKLETGGVQS